MSAEPREPADPAFDPAFSSLAAPEMRARVRLAVLVERIRRMNQRHVGLPLGSGLLRLWLGGLPGARLVERFGLPRHNLTRMLGRDALTVRIRPRELIQGAIHLPRRVARRPSSMAFLWDGDWDLRCEDLRYSEDNELSEVRDLARHRDHLEQSRAFLMYSRMLQAGKPHRSHREGIYLNSPERILEYLQLCLGFLDDMAAHGYQPQRAPDAIGVVISREGRILKYRRGRHRLAMAQWLDLPGIPVQVVHVHRLWWHKVTRGTTGWPALKRLRAALPLCRPEQAPGPLSDPRACTRLGDPWPRVPPSGPR